MPLGSDEFDYLEEEFGVNSEDSKTEAKPAIEPVKEEKTEIPKEEEIEISSEEPKIDEEESVIYAVKVTTKKEENALELIYDRVLKKNLEVYSIACPFGLRGYLFVEAKDRDNAEEAVFNLPYVKGLLPKTLSYEELRPMLEPKAAEVNIEKNDIVEIISEPFKKEKAKVMRIDRGREEAVVSLLNAVVPIPVTVSLDNLRVIRREEEEIENS